MRTKSKHRIDILFLLYHQGLNNLVFERIITFRILLSGGKLQNIEVTAFSIVGNRSGIGILPHICRLSDDNGVHFFEFSFMQVESKDTFPTIILRQRVKQLMLICSISLANDRTTLSPEVWFCWVNF